MLRWTRVSLNIYPVRRTQAMGSNSYTSKSFRRAESIRRGRVESSVGTKNHDSCSRHCSVLSKEVARFLEKMPMKRALKGVEKGEEGQFLVFQLKQLIGWTAPDFSDFARGNRDLFPLSIEHSLPSWASNCEPLLGSCDYVVYHMVERSCQDSLS